MAEEPGDSIEVPPGGVPWVYASAIALTLAGALFYLYLARAVPLVELGGVVILQAFAFIVSTAAALGLGRGFQHFLSYYRARADAPVTRTLVGISYLTTFLLSLVAVGITVALAGELSDLLFHSARYVFAIRLLGLFSGLLTAEMVLSGVLLGLQRYVAYSAVNILGSAAMYSIPIVFLLVSPALPSIVYGWILGAAIQTVASVVMIQRLTAPLRTPGPRPAVSLSPLYASLFTYSIPVLASLLITTGSYYIDRLILASIANLPTVGVYNYAILFASASLFVVTPFAAILVPRISALFGRDESRNIRALFRNANTLIVLAFVPLSLGVAALGPLLLRYVVGAAFVGGAFPMAVLLAISAVFVPFSNMVSLATGTRRTTVVMFSSSAALIANAVLSIALVPRFGMLGAALGNSAMFWAPFVVLYYVLRRTDLLDFDLSSIGRIWVSSVAMAVLIGVPMYLLDYSLVAAPIVVALGVLVFVALLRALHALPTVATYELDRHLPTWAAPVRRVIGWVAT